MKIMKKKTLLSAARSAVLAGLAGSLLSGQKIETVSPDANRIVHLVTALHHLTVIEVGEPVAMAAAGSNAFKIERKDDKVFVQPQEENASTNLFIWTASHRRYTYELETSPTVAQAQFALDYVPPEPVSQPPVAAAQPQPVSLDDLLLKGTPVRFTGVQKSQPFPGRVEVRIHDLYKDKEKGELLIRYSIRNRSKAAYQPGTPAIAWLQPPTLPYSLWNCRDSQIDGKLVRAFPPKENGTHLTATDVRSPEPTVDPGQTSFGVLKVAFPELANNDPTPRVVRFLFPSDDDGQVMAMLVL